MEIQYIREFLALAGCLSFSEAAEQMNMTQSSLSKHIQAMEQELRNTLFIRTSRSVSLSAFGEYFLPFARRIDAAHREAEDCVRSYTSRIANSFSVAVIRNPQYYNIDKMLIGFHKAYPDYHVNMIECDENEGRTMFLNNQVNLFASYGPVGALPDYPFVPVGQNEVVAVLPVGHPLAGQAEITIENLKNEPLLLPSRSTRMSQMILSALGIDDPRFALNIIYEGGSVVCLDFVKAGMGISLQPKETVEKQSENSICYRNIVPNIAYYYGLGHRQQHLLTRPENCFVNYLKENFRIDT